MTTMCNIEGRVTVALLSAICIMCASSAFAQTAVGVRIEYPMSGYVEVKSDNNYCITDISVRMRSVNIVHYKIAQKLCRAHLQELSLQGESSVDLKNANGSFGWELYIPFGRDEDNFGDVAGNYVFVLGKDKILKIETRKQ